MKIYYDGIENDQIDVSTAFSFEEDGELINIENFTGALFKTDGIYFLRGKMTFELHCACDRCTEPAVIKLKHDIEVGIETAGESAVADTEYEMTDDDGDIYTAGPEYIDLDDILRQEAILQLPVKRLCSGKCKVEEIEKHSDCDNEVRKQPNTPLNGLSSLKQRLKEK